MDVTVKGLFWLVEASRQSTTFEQFVVLGGDAAVGHCYFPKSLPVTEAEPHTAYPGCYALSKVLEEVVLEQYYRQYDLNTCCLRAP
jgi:nucleoside-diphosphate-sugar epimerase